MENTSDFQTDLEYGQFAEKLFNGYAINGSFEFKRDRRMHSSGNLFIEWESRGRPSGISMEHVQPVWVYYTDDCSFALMMDASRLRQALKRYKKECEDGLHEAPYTWDKQGGDNNTSRGFLIKATELVRIMLELANESAK